MEIKAIGCEPLQLKRMHIEDGHTLKVYQETGGYEVIKESAEDVAGRDHQRSKSVGLARARRRGFSDRDEMVVSFRRIRRSRNTSSATPTNQSPALSKTAT